MKSKAMPKVIVIQVVYNSRRWTLPVFSAILNQTFKDLKVVAVIAGNEDGGKELIAQKFPEVEIIDPGYNIGFARGHNLVFERQEAEFYQLINPDLIVESDYIQNILRAFEDQKVGTATGKLYKINSPQPPLLKRGGEGGVLDTTGVTISKSGRARDRGQHEVDKGQYDASLIVDAVSGAGAMYRNAALKDVRLQIDQIDRNNQKPAQSDSSDSPISLTSEFFDEDFHSYWEDVDLGWRMKNKGWKNIFVPSAIGYHGRAAGSSKKGYIDAIGFIKHHRALPEKIRQLNYKNHIFMYIKNSRWFYPQFFVSEFFMLCYIILFEISTLKVLPEFFKQLPKIWKKRKLLFR